MTDHDFETIPGNEYPKLAFRGTRGEQVELIRCVLEHFGQCECHPVFDMAGVQIGLHMCKAHQFINERDRNVTRLDRLLFVFRTRQYWMMKEELLFQCPECDAIYSDVRHSCPVIPVRYRTWADAVVQQAAKVWGNDPFVEKLREINESAKNPEVKPGDSTNPEDFDF